MRTLLLSLALTLTACTAPSALMPQTHHAIDYIELSVTDMDAARRFYTAAFGWVFNDYGPEYSGIQRPSGEGEVGGLALAESVTRGGPLVILYSQALEASRDAVTAAGGQIAQDIFEFPGGRRFHFLDPSGNELAVWSMTTPASAAASE